MNFRQLVKDAFSDLRRLTTYEAIGGWIEENTAILAINLQLAQGKRVIRPMPFEIRSVLFGDMTWESNLLNIFGAPLGKPTNFMRLQHLPKGYPGWHGYMDFLSDQEFELDDWRMMWTNSGLHLNHRSPLTDKQLANRWRMPLGKLGNQRRDGIAGILWRFEFVLFAEDWPSMLLFEKLMSDEDSDLNQ